MTTSELLILQSELRKQEKSLGLAYLMLLGGHLGLHRFYIKRYKSGTIQLVLFLLASVFYIVASILYDVDGLDSLAFVFIAATVLAGLSLLVWIIVDLFLMQRWIREWNREAEQKLVQKILQTRSENAHPESL